MSESRYDWLNDRWVFFAPQRAERPIELAADSTAYAPSHGCPFCIGQEWQTPDPLLQIAAPQPNRHEPWQVRVVPNRFPAIDCPEQDHTPQSATADQGSHLSASPFFNRQSMGGHHEVVIESPQHLTSWNQLSVAQLDRVLQAFQQRVAALRHSPRVRYLSIFKNSGCDAGASLAHVHSQVIATPVQPPSWEQMLGRCYEFFRAQGVGYFQRWIAEERGQQQRVVLDDRQFFVHCPFASPHPFQLMIQPHAATPFESLGASTRSSLAQLLKSAVTSLQCFLPDASYNVLIHLPTDATSIGWSASWWIEWTPRISKIAGFELASQCAINPIFPEVAAETWRKHWPRPDADSFGIDLADTEPHPLQASSQVASTAGDFRSARCDGAMGGQSSSLGK
jgi:UDPglucose--hexose-1-phosphate uridylyltransferase